MFGVRRYRKQTQLYIHHLHRKWQIIPALGGNFSIIMRKVHGEATGQVFGQFQLAWGGFQKIQTASLSLPSGPEGKHPRQGLLKFNQASNKYLNNYIGFLQVLNLSVQARQATYQQNDLEKEKAPKRHLIFTVIDSNNRLEKYFRNTPPYNFESMENILKLVVKIFRLNIFGKNLFFLRFSPKYDYSKVQIF